MMHMHAAPYAGSNFPTTLTSNTDAFMLDDFSHLAAAATSQPRRYSRGSSNYVAHTSSPMRVAKPSTSANNSPRSAMQARRRTMANDGLLARRNQQLLEHAFIPSPPTEPQEQMRRSARPVSWHPSSSQLLTAQHQQQFYAQPPPPQTMPMAQYPFPAYSEAGINSHVHQPFPPTPAAYSAYSSPTAYSPLSLPYSSFDAPQYATVQYTYHAPAAVSPGSDGGCPGLVGQQQAAYDTQDYFRGDATPPTPPTLAYPDDDSVLKPSLADEDEEEDDGEILVGMGLYDPPEKPAAADPSLDAYRMSLLGSSFGFPEPTGRGLKLEEKWEPPKDEEEEDDDDELEEDAESDD